MIPTYLNTKKYASLLKKVKEINSIDLRTKSTESLAEKMHIRNTKDKEIVAEIQAYSQFKNIKLDIKSKHILIEQAQIKSIYELIQFSPDKLLQLLGQNKQSLWAKIPAEQAVSKIKDIQKQANGLVSGKQFDMEILGLGKKSAEALVKAGIWCSEDLATIKISELENHAAIKKAGLTKERLITFKLKANMFAGAMVPSHFIELLHGLGVKTLFSLATANVNELIEKIKNEYLKASPSLQARLMDEINEFREKLDSYIKNSHEPWRIPDSVVQYLQAPNTIPVSNTRVALEHIGFATNIWKDYAEDKIPKADIWNNNTYCKCEWEESIFSEKAYLVYLMNSFGYTLQDLQDILPDEAYGNLECKKRTEIQEAIIRIQYDLRKNTNTSFLKKDLINAQRGFLSYEEWQSHMLNKKFPENKFEYVAGNIAFYLFPSLLNEWETRGTEIERFYTCLETAIAKMNIVAYLNLSLLEQDLGKIINDYSNYANVDADKKVRRPESLITDKTDYSNQNIPGSISDDLELQQTQTTPPNRKLLHGYYYDADSPDSVILDVAKSVKEMLFIYSDIAGALRNGYVKENWKLAISMTDGSNLHEMPYEGCQPLLLRFENLMQVLDGVITTQTGNTITTGGVSIEETYENIRINGRTAYENYKNLNRSLDIDNYSQHAKNVRNIVQSMMLINIESDFPYCDYLFSDSMKDFHSRLYYMINNNINLYFTDGVFPIVQGFADNNPNLYPTHFAFKFFGEPFPNTTVYNYLSNYTHFAIKSLTVIDRDDNLPSGYYPASAFLASPSLITERLSLSMEFESSHNIHWYNLAQLFYNLLYHLPYIKHFLIPIIHAEYERSECNYDNAARWLSLIMDHTSGMEVVTPFSLNHAEIDIVKIMLAEIWLDHAEMLFRQNDHESIQHARELYIKVVYYLFPADYTCFCNLNQGYGKYQERITALLKKDISLNLKHTFHKFIFACKHSAFADLQFRNELAKLSKLQGNTLESKIITFLTKHRKKFLTERSFIDNLEAYKSFLSKNEDIEADTILETPDVAYDLFTGVQLKDENGYTSNQYIKGLMNTSGSGNLKTPDKFIAGFAYNLCEYPNPKIVALVQTACKYLGYINSCRNFIGCRKDEISIYTYRELLRKSRHYLQMAITLEKDYLQWQTNLEKEERARIKGLQSVIKDHAQMALGELHLDEAQSMALIADLQLDRATHVRDSAQSEIDYQRSPLGVISKLWNGAAAPAISMKSAAYGLYQNSTSVGNYGSIASSGINMYNTFASWDHEFEMMDANLKPLEHDVDIASENINLAQLGVGMANVQQSINGINLILDSMYLQLLYNQVLGTEAYRYLSKRAKALYKTYVDMSIRMAWLAERQLEFLRGVELNTIRFDYYHKKQQSQNQALLLAAESLQKDVEELNYQRELSEKNRIRVIKTFSLRNEYPLLFAGFQNTGKFVFRTTADYLKLTSNGTELEYTGHTKYPDHFGYLQQRIDSVELRLIGLLGPYQDLRLSLSNMGISLVMIEEKGPGGFTYKPVLLRRPFQTIAFSRAAGENTANTYTFNAPEGILKPFETTGLDTSWELEVDKVSNKIDLQEIFDIQLIINYRAEYSNHYESAQRALLPESLSRTRIFSFRDNDFTDIYYNLHNPALPFPGFRDLHILSFETHPGLFGPNEAGREMQKLYLYIHSQEKLTPMIWKVGYNVTNAGTIRYSPIPTQFENSFDDPGNPGNIIESKGLIDCSHDASGFPKNLAVLLHVSKDISRKWSIKIIPENLPEQYWKKNIAGNYINTRGNPLDNSTPELLHAKTEANAKRIALNTPANVLYVWDNYSIQIKFKLIRGSFIINWRMYGNKGIFLRLREGAGTSCELTLGTFSGSSETNAPDTSEWTNPLRFDLDSNDWYLLECSSYINEDNPDKNFVAIKIDTHIVWKGEINLSTGANYGGVRLAILENSEVICDDLWIQRINRRGNPVETLFADTFDGSKINEWNGMDNDDSVLPFMTLKPDDNIALDLQLIENILFIIDYNYKVK